MWLYAIWNEITVQIREFRTFLKQLDIINKTAAGIFTIYTKERCFFRRLFRIFCMCAVYLEKAIFCMYILISVSIWWIIHSLAFRWKREKKKRSVPNDKMRISDTLFWNKVGKQGFRFLRPSLFSDAPLSTILLTSSLSSIRYIVPVPFPSPFATCLSHPAPPSSSFFTSSRRVNFSTFFTAHFCSVRHFAFWEQNGSFSEFSYCW